MKKEEHLAIRAAIYKFYADGGKSELGKFGRYYTEFDECKAIRLLDGRVLVIQDGRIFSGKKPDGRVIWDDEIEKIVLTEEDIKNSVQISCLDCHVFKNCWQLNSIVNAFKNVYGCPKSVETVEAIHRHMLEKRKQKRNYEEQKEQINGTIIQQSRVLNGTGLSLRSDLCEINSPFWQTSIQVSGGLSSTTENVQEQDEDTPQRDDESYIIGCPFCGQHLEVPIELDNTTVNCPSCNKEVYLTKEDAIKEHCSEKNGSYRFECPFCQVNLEVPDELDNTTINCPACNKEIHLTKKDSIN